MSNNMNNNMNYVNNNIDWKGFPGAPPTDCCIM